VKAKNTRRFYSPYVDPIYIAEERPGTASRLAKQQATLGRAKIAERWIVFTTAGILVSAVLPVVLVVAALVTPIALARWIARRGKRRITVHSPLARWPRLLDSYRTASWVAATRECAPPPRLAVICTALMQMQI